MTTADQLRRAIKFAAENSMKDSPTDADLRAVNFVARLSGALDHLGETELEQVVWALLGIRPGAVASVLQAQQ